MGILPHSIQSTMMLRIFLALAVMAVAVHSQYSSGWRWPRQNQRWDQRQNGGRGYSGMRYSSGMGFSGMQGNRGQMCADRSSAFTCQQYVGMRLCSSTWARRTCRKSCGACGMNSGMSNGMSSGMNNAMNSGTSDANSRSLSSSQDGTCTDRFPAAICKRYVDKGDCRYTDKRNICQRSCNACDNDDMNIMGRSFTPSAASFFG